MKRERESKTNKQIQCKYISGSSEFMAKLHDYNNDNVKNDRQLRFLCIDRHINDISIKIERFY